LWKLYAHKQRVNPQKTRENFDVGPDHGKLAREKQCTLLQLMFLSICRLGFVQRDLTF
jgi:hypothetical protein